MDRADEVALAYGHREFDGVEVPLAVEATPQVRARIECRVILLATGAQECQLAVTILVGPAESHQQELPGNIIGVRPGLMFSEELDESH